MKSPTPNTSKGIVLMLLSIFVAIQSISAKQPNIIVIFADDLGYGDLACFGHPTIATPNLDHMAAEGQKWTDFYVASPVCTPSRAGLLTGRYPLRSGTHAGVFFEWSAEGLPSEEVTIAEILKGVGYTTGMVGKWHLGHRTPYLPTRQGFDSYYGIPYSNDMRIDPQMPVADDILFREGMTLEKMRARGNKVNDWVPLMEDEEVVEYPCDQTTLTQRYTDKCIEFIKEHKAGPFFLYYAQSFPHIPLFASEDFKGTSKRGLYGDVVEEMDHSIGRILETLRNLSIDEDTLVVFTSDNGPWVTQNQQGGSAGLLKGAKGQTFEGGMREPTIFWWPGKLKTGIVRECGSTLDLMATFATLSGSELPATELDSYDLSQVLTNGKPSPRETFFYYRGAEIYAIRHHEWKVHFITQGSYGRGPDKVVHETPLLYNLDHDPSEQYNLAEKHPEIIAKLTKLKALREANVKAAPNRLEKKLMYQDLPEWAH